MLDQGDCFPRFEVDTLDHGHVILPDYLAGAYGTVLVFRGSWCVYCVGQLRSFTRSHESLTESGVRVIAMSVDDEGTTRALAEKVGVPFALGHSVDPGRLSRLTGTFVNAEPRFLQSTGFVLDPEGRTLVSVYSSNAIGRLVPEDVIGLINYLKSHSPEGSR